jgi:hypothetical protein
VRLSILETEPLILSTSVNKMLCLLKSNLWWHGHGFEFHWWQQLFHPPTHVCWILNSISIKEPTLLKEMFITRRLLRDLTRHHCTTELIKQSNHLCRAIKKNIFVRTRWTDMLLSSMYPPRVHINKVSEYCRSVSMSTILVVYIYTEPVCAVMHIYRTSKPAASLHWPSGTGAG